MPCFDSGFKCFSRQFGLPKMRPAKRVKSDGNGERSEPTERNLRRLQESLAQGKLLHPTEAGDVLPSIYLDILIIMCTDILLIAVNYI